MGLTLTNFHIPEKPYLTKKLDHNTLSKVLESSPFVVHGIYMLKNGAEQRIDLLEQEHIGPYKITAYVKINWAYASEARAQVANVKPLRKLIRKKPSYDLRISIKTEALNSIYTYDQRFTRINQLIDNIRYQTEALRQFAAANKLETK